MHKICAIVTAFNTPETAISALLTALHERVDVIVVDNSTDPQCMTSIRRLVNGAGGVYEGMGGNAGIGAAENRGIRIAAERGFPFVLLLDDDSMPHSEMAARLLDAHARATRDFNRSAVVCARPCLTELDTGVTRADRPGDLVSRRDMTSSGSLIPMDVLSTVGSLDEDLFVDFVDYDWGWRARAAGVPIVVATDARFLHRIGEGDRNVCGMTLHVPSPSRHYYQVRNLFLLWSRPYVPLTWKLARLLLTPFKFAVLLAFLGDRAQRLRYFADGVRDGIRGTRGRVPGQ